MRFISKFDIKLDFLSNILCPYLGCYKLIKIINKYPKHNILKRRYRQTVESLVGSRVWIPYEQTEQIIVDQVF